ncbi:MAG: OsmC family protein [Spirochaeta sp.]|jgi:uncharacterized OsmC-like protein|nr:OsmC family protein [Spirochaeta sp.]
MADTQTYSVTLQRHSDGNRTTASVRDFSITLGCKAGDLSWGFNAAETLLAAAGTCITTSLTLVARNSKITLEELNVSVAGVRQSDPPRLISAEIEVAVASPADDGKIDRIFEIAGRNSTVLSTLREAMDVRLSWKRA